MRVANLFLALAAAAADEPQFEIVSVLHHDEALARPHDIEVQDRISLTVNHLYPPKLAFVAGKGGSVAVIDVDDPANPKIVWWRRDQEVHDDAQTVLPLGSRLILGSRNIHNIRIPGRFDIDYPFIPPGSTEDWESVRQRYYETAYDHFRTGQILAEQDRYISAPEIDRVNGMVQRGNAALAACKHGWISVIDIEYLSVIGLRDALDANTKARLESPHDLALYDSNRRLVVVNQRRGADLKARVFKIGGGLFGKKLRPAEKWKIEGSVSGENLNGANRVDIYGRYAVFACSPGMTIGVIDLSNPDKPRTVAVLPFADEHPTGLTIAGTLAFVGGGRVVEVIDLSDPENPASRAVFRLDSVLPTGRDNIHDLVYRDGLLYITAQNDNRIVIVRVLDQQLLELANRPKPDDRLAPGWLRAITATLNAIKPNR